MYEILVLFVGVRGQAAPPYPQTGRSVRIPMDGSTMSTEWRGLLSSKDQLSRLYKLTSFGNANLSNKINSLGFGLDIFRIFKFKRLIWITELLNFRFLRLNNFFLKNAPQGKSRNPIWWGAGTAEEERGGGTLPYTTTCQCRGHHQHAQWNGTAHFSGGSQKSWRARGEQRGRPT